MYNGGYDIEDLVDQYQDDIDERFSSRKVARVNSSCYVNMIEDGENWMDKGFKTRNEIPDFSK